MPPTCPAPSFASRVAPSGGAVLGKLLSALATVAKCPRGSAVCARPGATPATDPTAPAQCCPHAPGPAKPGAVARLCATWSAVRAVGAAVPAVPSPGSARPAAPYPVSPLAAVTLPGAATRAAPSASCPCAAAARARGAEWAAASASASAAAAARVRARAALAGALQEPRGLAQVPLSISVCVLVAHVQGEE